MLVVCCRRSVTLGPVGVQSLLCYVDVRCLLYAVGGLSHWVQLGSSHFSVMLMSGGACLYWSSWGPVTSLLYAVGGLSHWVQLGSSHFSVMLMSGACCML